MIKELKRNVRAIEKIMVMSLKDYSSLYGGNKENYLERYYDIANEQYKKENK